MLVCYVNSRRHSPRLRRPCRGASRGPSSLLALSRLQELLLYIHPSPITHLQSTLPQVFILENLKPFRCNTYEKTGGGVVIMVNQVLGKSHLPSSPFRVAATLWLPCRPFSVRTSKFRIPQLLCLPLLRKLPGCVPTIPNLVRTTLDWKCRKEGSGEASLARIDIKDGDVNARLRFDRVGGGVPGDGGFAEIGFVGHVAGEGGVVAEDGVFGDLLMIAHTLEKSPKVRFLSVPGFAAKSESFLHRLLAGLGIVVLVPFLEIGFAHRLRIAVSVIAGRFVFAGVRKVGNGEFRDFEDGLV